MSGRSPQAQQPQITSVGSEPQRALVNTIVVGHEAIDSARKQLDTRMQFPEIGTDPVSAVVYRGWGWGGAGDEMWWWGLGLGLGGGA